MIVLEESSEEEDKPKISQKDFAKNRSNHYNMKGIFS